ncbi:MAG: PEP-CTERM sorting domain-containing protein [Armatimonadota bacterium]|nr:PEP-CTERM sorting domain-containing protein [bacterium]MDW8320585.1 PEP-CTERM sorting domain-containing protein [Armatimonadota bacterium]
MLTLRYAVAGGLLLLLCLACLQARSQPPTVFQPPRVIYRHTSPVQSVHINNNGWIVWSEGGPTRSDVWLYDGSQVRRLSAGEAWRLNTYPRINNFNQVVWRYDDGNLSDVVLWDSGVLMNITRSDGSVGFGAPDINDSGWVVTTGTNLTTGYQDVYLWKPGYSDPENLTYWAGFDSQNPRINNLGEIVWNAVDAEANPQIYLAHADDMMNYRDLTSNVVGDDYSSPDLNDRGQVVWMHHNGSNWNIELWSEATGVVALTSNTGNAASTFPDINNWGWIFYEQSILFRKYDVHLFAEGTIIPITDNTDPVRSFRVALNDRGELVWVTREDIGGVRYWSIMLAQPVPEPATGVVLLSGVGLLALWRRKRGQV